MERSDGLLGTIHWIDEQSKLAKKNESYVIFDIELSLLYWPSYLLIRWQPNILNHRFDVSYTRWLKTTLMVSRLVAPTVAFTKKLIDTAIEVEKTGLQGKFYLDARGLGRGNRPTSRGSYADYDKSLRYLAEILKDHTKQTVVLDNKKELFGPGDCPQSALYCGWYSLAKYVDAFDWKKGAVAYHLASGEADRKSVV